MKMRQNPNRDKALRHSPTNFEATKKKVHIMHKWIKPISLAASIFMFFILLGGALVTKTGSGKACGETWPLCNGEFIPSFTIPELIEYSHRIVTGMFSLLLLALVILIFMYEKRKDVRWLAVGASIFTILQAFLGAMAALKEQSSIVMALHFGISLVAFACTILIWVAYTRAGEYVGRGADALRKLSGGFRTLIWVTLVYCYIVVYVGAYVRHTESAGGCLGWPLCNGEWVPELTGATGIMFMHRLAALTFVLLVLALLIGAARRYRTVGKVYAGSAIALALAVLQAFSGALVTWSLGNEDAYLLTALLHGVIIAGLFTTLCYLAVLTLHAPKSSSR